MQQNVKNNQRLLFSRWGLAVTALAVVGVVALSPTWVNAANGTELAFTSPLAPPAGHHPPGADPELRELLDEIIDRDAILAEILGMTAEELQAAHASGTKLDELITQAGLDKETVRAAVKSAVETAVAQAVTDGVITEEQAEQILNPPAPPEQGERRGGHRPPGGPDGGNSGQPGGTIPDEPGGTIPDANSNSDTATDANSASADTASDAPPQRPGQRERGQDAGGGQRPRR